MQKGSAIIVRLITTAGVIFACCVGTAGPAVAQAEPPAAVVSPDSALVDVDRGPERSPGGAFLRSLVIPGWGQAWVGAPTRGGIYFAIESVSAFMVFKTASQLGEARAEQAFLRETGLLESDQKTELVTAREGQMEDWITFSIFMLFFSGADAYVAAYLADFSEHVGVAPAADGTMNIQATIPVGGR